VTIGAARPQGDSGRAAEKTGDQRQFGPTKTACREKIPLFIAPHVVDVPALRSFGFSPFDGSDFESDLRSEVAVALSGWGFASDFTVGVIEAGLESVFTTGLTSALGFGALGFGALAAVGLAVGFGVAGFTFGSLALGACFAFSPLWPSCFGCPA
jgi:hypothetical protein